MENESQNLIPSLDEFIALIEGEDGATPAEGSTGDEAPHVELIDFDRLGRTLREIKTRLDDGDKQDREEAVVRQWLTGRIESFRRGRQAICGERRPSSSLEGASLPDLARAFDEEMARLRSTAERNHKPGVRRKGNAADAFSHFKS